jgi:hypothetical protein
MILLHGGLSVEMIAAFLGGFLSSLALFIIVLAKGRRKLNPDERRTGLIKLFVIAGVISFVSFYFFVFLFAWIASLFI